MRINCKLKEYRHNLFMLALVLVGFIAIELTGCCSVLFNMGLSPAEMVSRHVKLLIRIVFLSFIFIIPIILFVKRNYFPAIVCLMLYSLFAWSNLLYVRMFGTIIPFPMYMETQNLNGLSDSITGLIKGSDLLFVFIPVLVLLVYVFINKRVEILPFKKRLVIAGISLLLPAVFITSLAIKWQDVMRKEQSTLKDIVVGEFTYQSKRFYCDYGLLSSVVVSGISPYSAESAKYDLSADEKKKIETFFQSNKFYPVEDRTPGIQKKNLIILLMESLNSKALEAQIGKNYVMSNLHELMQEKETLFSSKVKHLEQTGESIAGQFNLLTGLIGTPQVPFCIQYPANTYHSLVKALKKKYPDLSSTTIVETSRSFWRQDVVDRSFGVDSLFGNEDISFSGNTGTEWISDETLFEYSYNKLEKKIDSPFYMLIVTCDMHAPYTNVKECGLAFSSDVPLHLRSYYAKAYHVDQYIGKFMDRLKKLGDDVYKETLVVIVADHQVPMVYMDGIDVDEDIANIETLSAYTPVLFVNTGCDMREMNKLIENDEFLQEQVYPTILSLLDLSNEEYNGLFPSMFDTLQCRKYDFGDVSRGTTDSLLNQAFHISDLIIKGNYWREPATRNE